MKVNEHKDAIYHLAKEAKISVHYPIIQGLVPAFEGLKVLEPLGCPCCPYAASIKVVQKHIKQNHPGQLSDSTQLSKIKVQVLNIGHSPSYFRVMTDDDPMVASEPEGSSTIVGEMH